MFEFDYRLVGSGWAEAHVGDAEDHVELTASYLSDALRALLEAVALTVEGVSEARCSWDEEPGEYRWIFRRSANQVDLEILVFDELWGDEPDAVGRTVFSTTQDVSHLGDVIHRTAQALLDDLGLREYRRRWVQHDFPAQALERLRLALQ